MTRRMSRTYPTHRHRQQASQSKDQVRWTEDETFISAHNHPNHTHHHPNPCKDGKRHISILIRPLSLGSSKLVYAPFVRLEGKRTRNLHPPLALPLKHAPWT